MHLRGRSNEILVSEKEIREIGMNVEMIEDYPEDKYFPVLFCSVSLKSIGHYIFRFHESIQISQKLLLYMNLTKFHGLITKTGDDDV